MKADLDKALRLIGIAHRGRNTACGRTAAELALQKKEAYLLIIARDAAERTEAQMGRLAEQECVPWLALGDRESLGRMTGSSLRAVLAITDSGLARAIISAADPSTEAAKS